MNKLTKKRSSYLVFEKTIKFKGDVILDIQNSKNENVDMFSEYEDIVSVDDVMKMLHIGRSNVYKLLREKEIKCVRVGVKYIIPKKSIIEFIETNQIA